MEPSDGMKRRRTASAAPASAAPLLLLTVPEVPSPSIEARVGVLREMRTRPRVVKPPKQRRKLVAQREERKNPPIVAWILQPQPQQPPPPSLSSLLTAAPMKPLQVPVTQAQAQVSAVSSEVLHHVCQN